MFNDKIAKLQKEKKGKLIIKEYPTASHTVVTLEDY